MSFAGTQKERDYQIGHWFQLWETVVSRDYPELAQQIVIGEATLTTMTVLCRTVLDGVRNYIGYKVRPSSFLRSRALNDAVGGSWHSQHVWGEAVDFKIPDHRGRLIDAFSWIRENFHYTLGQLILYYDDELFPVFIHVSLTPIRSSKGIPPERKYLWHYKGKFHRKPPT